MKPLNDTFALVESDIKSRVKREEEEFSKQDRGSDTLWDHLLRVASLAVTIGTKEGVDPVECRLAGLFHDAGKFHKGQYHRDDAPEEERAVTILVEAGKERCIDSQVVDRVAEAIRQLYRDDPDLSDLAKVLFDADNLDKLGPLGVANYFIKTGLRGGGVSEQLLSQLTIELTYAKHAPSCLHTETGRELAGIRAPETTQFLKHFLETLRTDGLYEFDYEEVVFNGLELCVVTPLTCSCGGKFDRRIWEVPGMKCTEIHLEHSCSLCEIKREFRFCKPRLVI